MFEKELYLLSRKKIKHGIYEKLKVQITYGVNLKESIAELLKRVKKSGRSIEFMILTDIKHNIALGKTFSDAMKKWIPQFDYTILVSSEKSGKIAEALDLIISLDNMKSELMSDFLGGMINPFILFLAVYGFLYYLGKYALKPILSMIPAGHKVTGAAGILILMSKFINSPWMYLIPVLFIILLISIFLSFPKFTGSIRKKMDRYFPYSVYRKFTGSIWLIGFSSLMSAGINETNALKEMARYSNAYLKERITTFYKGLQNGMNLGEAMNISKYGFPDSETVEDIGVFSNFPNFDERLRLIAEHNIKSMKKYIKVLSNSLSLIANLFLYAIVIFIAVSVFSLMNNITNSLHLM